MVLAGLLWACTSSGGNVLVTRPDTAGDTAKNSNTDRDSDSSPPDTGVDYRSPLGMLPVGISDWSTAWPLIDLMKQSREWTDWVSGDTGPVTVDDRGWVTSLSEGQTAGTVFLANDDGPALFNRVLVRYDGSGTISYHWSAVKVEEASAPGADVVEVSTGNHLLQIDATDPADYLRNISIVPEPLVPDFDNGETFTPVWLDRMKEVGVLRFANWTGPMDVGAPRWADRPLQTDRSWTVSGFPWTAAIDLCNRLQVHPWINVPLLADDNYVRELATAFRDTLDPSLVVLVEHADRIWDPQMRRQPEAEAESFALLGDAPDALLQWHAAQTAAICDIFKTVVFADAPHRVRCVLSLPEDATAAAETALACPDFVAQESGRVPCAEHGFDVLAISAAFDGCLGDEAHMDQIRPWFADSDGGLTRGMEQLADGRHLSGCTGDVASREAVYRGFAELAADRGLSLYAFEGGQHVTAVGTPLQEDPDVIAFHLALNRDGRMRDRYLEHFDVWQRAGGRLFVHFGDAGIPGKYGSWGALESIVQDTSPKWEALMEFAATPIWWSD